MKVENIVWRSSNELWAQAVSSDLRAKEIDVYRAKSPDCARLAEVGNYCIRGRWEYNNLDALDLQMALYHLLGVSDDKAPAA